MAGLTIFIAIFKFASDVIIFAVVTPGPSLGFPPLVRGSSDGSQLWTMVQTTGFPTAGLLFFRY